MYRTYVDRARMSTNNIAVVFFLIAHTLVHTNAASAHDFLRSLGQKGCRIDEEQVRCGLGLNGTFHSVQDSFGNGSTVVCCAICSEKAFIVEITRKPSQEDEINSKIEEKAARSYLLACLSNNCSNVTGPFLTVRVGAKCTGDSDGDGYGDVEDDEDKPRNETHRWNCDSVFTSLNFWGANIVIFANAIYIIPYLVVVFVYFVVPGLRARAYDRAVICYNISQIALNGILIGMGSFVLCHISIHSIVYSLLGITIMFLTISSTFWLVVICFDMTLAITRFRWAPPSDANHHEEKKKFWIYAGWTWGGTFLPTAFVTVLELSPLLSRSSPMKPNFAKFDQGANLAVILYVASLPLLACLANTALFCYTTYKMIQIRRSTALASANSTARNDKRIRKKYVVFVRLYLLMDAPWLTSTLAAAFTDLWILKFLRMIQPILMLLAILPPGTITRVFRSSTHQPTINPT